MLLFNESIWCFKYLQRLVKGLCVLKSCDTGWDGTDLQHLALLFCVKRKSFMFIYACTCESLCGCRAITNQTHFLLFLGWHKTMTSKNVRSNKWSLAKLKNPKHQGKSAWLLEFSLSNVLTWGKLHVTQLGFMHFLQRQNRWTSSAGKSFHTAAVISCLAEFMQTLLSCTLLSLMHACVRWQHAAPLNRLLCCMQLWDRESQMMGGVMRGITDKVLRQWGNFWLLSYIRAISFITGLSFVV